MNSEKHDSENRQESGSPSPGTYYRAGDEPTRGEKASMWTAVAQRLPGSPNAPAPAHTGGPSSGRDANAASPERETAFHWRSFWLGQAAAVLLLLALFGGYTLMEHLDGTTPDTPLQQTYRSSLQELASSTQYLSPPSSDQQQEALESELRGLKEIDRMIEEMRSDMLLNGSTQAKRKQLRRLYATKLDFVQKLILTEEVSS